MCQNRHIPPQNHEMKRALFFALLLAFCATALHAQQRKMTSVMQIASEYIKQEKRLRGTTNLQQVNPVCKMPNSIRSITGNDENKMPFYLITDSTMPSKYVIISGDERMKTILAYGTQGRWEEDSIPDGLNFMLETYRQQYEMLQSGNVTKRTTATDINIPDVEPLMETAWSQESPYNDLCPRNCPSGCVATAMSQVMKYHQYPSSGTGSFTYTSSTRRYRCSYDFASSTFEWDKMQNTYGASGFQTESSNAVAQIMYACGVSVGMDYDKSGSGAYMSDVPYALIHFFGYNNNVVFYDRGYYDAREWYRMLCNELLTGRPVIYGGIDSRNGGHAFVIDGCNAETRKFHVNWGWNGDFNDYYELDALDPQTYKFSSYQDMVVGIVPETMGEHEDVFYAESFSISPKIALGKSVELKISDVYCYSSKSSYVVPDAKFYGRIGVGIFDDNFVFISSIDSDTITGLNNFYGYSKLTYTSKITGNMFPTNGTYHIAPYVIGKGSEKPTRIRTSGGTSDYVTITVTDDDISSTGGDEDPTEVVSAWVEDFEDMTIPGTWRQEIELGTSEWKARYVLTPSDEMPAAAHGRGYVYLNYATGLDIYNSRTVVRLITPTISLDSDKQYNLSVQYRKYSTMPESSDVLTIYYKDGNEWCQISDFAVSNQSDWHRASCQLPDVGNVKLAFEGSPANGSSIFLDEIKIYDRQDEVSGLSEIAEDTDCNVCDVYSLSGALLRKGVCISTGNICIPHGTYIIRNAGISKKIFVK